MHPRLAPAPLLAIALAVALAAPPARGDAASTGLDQLKTLAGEWAGKARSGDNPSAQPTKATIRVVSGGSAVMLVTDPGTPHEMVTLFHEDDGALLATHYCAAMNQPRLKATTPTATGQLVFEFMDGTNLKAHSGRMQRLALTVLDERRHAQAWTFADENGKTSTMKLEMARAGGPAPAAASAR
jgi:hypothetical protein